MSSRTESSSLLLPAAAERALPAGARLDDCEIERVIALSSLAVVYRAYDHARRLPVAIKEYMPEALAQRSGAAQVVLRTTLSGQRFERGLHAFIGEAQTLARFDNPSLLRVDRIMQRNGTAYRVMRYTPGPTLLAHRRALPQAPDAATLRAWFDALLGALEAMHSEGWMHAFVSPGNILLLRDGRPLLMDFGAVRAAVIDQGTQDMLAALEPSFEPIEQRNPAAGLAQGPWTDLYSLAATLRYCISGKPPTAPDAEPVQDGWQSLRDDPPGLGAGLVAALEACLAEVPQDRPQSVAQVRGLLQRAGHYQTTGPSVPPAPPAPGAPIERAADAPLAAAVEAVAEPASAPEDAASDSAADAARAKVIADLERTFALIEAQAGGPAGAAALRGPAPAAPAPLAATPPQVQPEPQPQPQPAPPPGPQVQPHPRVQAQAQPAQRRWPIGVAALVLLGLLIAAWLMLAGPDRGSVEGAAESAPAVIAAAPTTTSPAAAPPVASPPAPSTTPPASASPARAQPLSVAPVAPPAPRATPTSATSAGATTKSQSKPSASATTNTPPSRASASTSKSTVATSGPRAQCAKRSGYALYQCMQAQCAKRSFAKHPECQRLRKEQRLP